MLITKILSPLSYIFVKSDDLINKRNSKVINNQNISVENLTNAISQANSDLNDETDFVTGIVNYWNINAREIMKPRVNVIAAEIKYDFEKLMAIIVETSYSRIPVYEDTFDNIKGVLYIKDLLPYINSNIDFEWRKLIRKPYFVPENKRINVLLEKFQKNKIHMAIVIDEYAGVLGIVTLEDVFEEIIGEIAKESNYTKIEENTYLFDGNILLNDFYKSLDIQDDIFEKIRGDADSLAGLILEIKGKIPLKGAIVEFENFTFTVTSVDSRKIKKVKLKINKI